MKGTAPMIREGMRTSARGRARLRLAVAAALAMVSGVGAFPAACADTGPAGKDAAAAPAQLGAILADYARFQREMKSWARREAVDLAFGPVRVDIARGSAGADGGPDAGSAPSAEKSCTVRRTHEIDGEPVTVIVTAPTCLEAYEAAE